MATLDLPAGTGSPAEAQTATAPTRLFSFRLGLPAVAIAMSTASLIFTKTGRDAIFVSSTSILDLPWAYVLIAATAPPAAMGTLALLRLVGVRKARVALILAAAVIQLISIPALQSSGSTASILWFAGVPVVYGVVLSMVWVLASELGPGTGRTMPEVFSMFAAASLIGGVLASTVSRLASSYIAPVEFVFAGAAILGCTAAITGLAHRRFPEPAKVGGALSSPPDASIGLIPLVKNRYIQMLAAVMVASGFAGVLIEFWFYAVAAASTSSASQTASIFASYYLLLNLLGLVIQLAVVPVLQKRLGMSTGLIVLPLALGLGSALVAMRVIPPFAFRLIESSLKSSVQRSTWEQSYVLVAGAVRSAVKLLVDGLAFRSGEGLAAALLLALGPLALQHDGMGLSSATVAILALSLVSWTIVTFRLRSLVEKQERCMIDQHLHPETHPPDGCSLTASFASNYVQAQQPTQRENQKPE